MHSLRPGIETGLHDSIRYQVAFRRRRRTDMDRFIRYLDVQSIAIGIGVNRDRLDAHFLRRLDDAASDLATISYKDFFKQWRALP